MELGKPIRRLVVEPVSDPKQQTVANPERQVREREPIALPTTPSR
jgi:hypothetical protein